MGTQKDYNNTQDKKLIKLLMADQLSIELRGVVFIVMLI